MMGTMNTQTVRMSRRRDAWSILGLYAFTAALIILAVFLLFVSRWQVVRALFMTLLVIANVASYVGKRKRARSRHPAKQ
jgi:glucan phosphoethanolaminetransferase (alkaline phosphatase superfamily)